MAISKEAARSFPGDYRRVFEAVCTAVLAEGMRVTFADPASGNISVSSEATMLSWGENSAIQVAVDAAGVTWVWINSSLKFGLVDWGKNQKNIDRLFARVDAVLGQAPGGGAWHPDPTGRHQLRWWDGAAWTAHVSDAGVTTNDPI